MQSMASRRMAKCNAVAWGHGSRRRAFARLLTMRANCVLPPLALEPTAHAGSAEGGAPARRDGFNTGSHFVQVRLAGAYAAPTRLALVPSRDAHPAERGLMDAGLSRPPRAPAVRGPAF